MHTYEGVLSKLRNSGSAKNAEGMRRFGISGEIILGTGVPAIRKLGREIGTDHWLAVKLWDSGIHEARILATIIEDPVQVSEEQVERWVKDIDSWDLCDHFCGNFVVNTRFAWDKIRPWTDNQEEFVRRAGFVTMAELAIKDREAEDQCFMDCLQLIKSAIPDGRNFVKKAMNWAIRQIGKRNLHLNGEAINVARDLVLTGDRTLRWIGNDALRELRSPGVQSRVQTGRS